MPSSGLGLHIDNPKIPAKNGKELYEKFVSNLYKARPASRESTEISILWERKTIHKLRHLVAKESRNRPRTWTEIFNENYKHGRKMICIDSSQFETSITKDRSGRPLSITKVKHDDWEYSNASIKSRSGCRSRTSQRMNQSFSDSYYNPGWRKKKVREQ